MHYLGEYAMRHSRIIITTAAAAMTLATFAGISLAGATAAPATTTVARTPATKPATVSQDNAKAKALDYLDYSSFSRTGLIKQLKYEGFSTADATYGVDATHTNWNRQAALKARDYLDYDSFSRTGLIKQLKYEGFTTAQATYGVKVVGL